MTYAKIRSRSVGAIVVVAAIAAGIVVTLAGGASAATHGKAVAHHSKTTAHLEKHKPGTRDVGFTG